MLQHLPGRPFVLQSQDDGRLSPALETVSQSAGLRTKICCFRVSRADWIMENQFINLLVVLLPVGSA